MFYSAVLGSLQFYERPPDGPLRCMSCLQMRVSLPYVKLMLATQPRTGHAFKKPIAELVSRRGSS